LAFTDALKRNAPLYFLALGAFAIGTEGFMIAGLLPVIAGDLQVSLATAGQLITVFSFTYAISSPVLTTLSGAMDRRRLLLLALALFTVANFLAFAAPGYWTLMAARILLAIASGLYMPSANALAGALVAPERRGRALATVSGGITIAVALGVPLGATIGHALGWRMTFACVGVLSTLVTLGVMIGLRRDIGANIPPATLSERLAVARDPAVLMTLLTTMLWAVGIWTIYPYLAPFLAHSAGIEGGQVGAVLLLYGVCAWLGVFVSGRAIDRIGSRQVLIASLVVMGVSYVSLTVCARFLGMHEARVPILVAIAAWGVAGWAFNPAQQAKLIGVAGLKVAPISLSLNASFIYLGFGFGAALGSLILTVGTVVDIGWVGGLFEFAALALLLLTGRKRAGEGRAAAAAST
jgi:predicted MFS family arabinose efflux permease